MIALLLLLSAAGKSLAPQATLDVFADVWGVTGFHASSALWSLILVETVLAVGLLHPGTRRLSAAVTGCFILALSVSPAVQLLTNSRSGCGCGLGVSQFGPHVEQTLALVRNGLLVYLAFRLGFIRVA